MGEKRTAAQRAAWLTAALALLCSAALALQISYLSRVRTRLEDETLKVTLELGAERGRLEEAESARSELESGIRHYEDLDQEIERKKKEFFTLAGNLEQKVLSGETDIKIAYLTFDDGPYDNTANILDVLKRYDIQATFFQRGRDWDTYGEIFLREYAEGHTMGNHTYSHIIHGANRIYRTADVFMEDLLRNRAHIQEHMGVTTDVMRFPGGVNWTLGLRDEIVARVKEAGYSYVEWDVSCKDGSSRLTPAEYRDNILKNTKGRSLLVVLMHEYSGGSTKALPEVIEGLREQGYVFLPLWHDSAVTNRTGSPQPESSGTA